VTKPGASTWIGGIAAIIAAGWDLASDRCWDEAVKPLELRVGYEREEAWRLHADQGVGCAAKNSG
jgi:hypothetical protein